MTTHAAMPRMPFGEVSSNRLQQLASLKNRQNGIVTANDVAKPFISASPTTCNGKRSYDTAIYEDDSENIDPSQLDTSAKKSKAAGGSITLISKPIAPMKSSIKASEPSRLFASARVHAASPLKQMTIAPAGRSPKKKLLGLSQRRSNFTRIDPPFSSSSSSALPFSLDAALSSTLGKPADKQPAKTQSKWSFKIHEDTPDEEAAIYMEHSTLTLDLSSDDEAEKSKRSDLGKENIAPEGYSAPAASRVRSTEVASVAEEKDVEERSHKHTGLRRKILPDVMDDDQRSPLSELEVVAHAEEAVDDASAIVPSRESFDFVSVASSKDAVAQESLDREIVVFEDSTEVAPATPAAGVTIEVTSPTPSPS